MQLRVPTGIGVGVLGVLISGVLISGFLVGGCVFDPSGLSFAGDADPAARDGGPGGDGAIDGDGDGADAGCSPAPGGETCNGHDDDCDMVVDEGFGNSDPLCAGAIMLEGVDGDRSNETVSTVGATEAWYRVRIRDTRTYSELQARVTLRSPAGADYDLHVYCESCGATPLRSSTTHSVELHTDLVTVTRPDVFLDDVSFDLLVEVRFHTGASVCDEWVLTVEGNRTTDPRVECARP